VPTLEPLTPIGGGQSVALKRDVDPAILKKLAQAWLDSVNSDTFQEIDAKQPRFPDPVVLEDADRRAALWDCVASNLLVEQGLAMSDWNFCSVVFHVRRRCHVHRRRDRLRALPRRLPFRTANSGSHFGPLADQNLRRTIRIFDGKYEDLLLRPVGIVLFIAVVWSSTTAFDDPFARAASSPRRGARRGAGMPEAGTCPA
jgi:hypothetical protein